MTTSKKPRKSPPPSATTQPTGLAVKGDEAKARIIDNLTTTVIAVPLLRMMEKESAHHLDVAWQYFKKKPDKDNPAAATRVNKG